MNIDPFCGTAGKQRRRDPNAMTQINWSIILIELPQSK
jgi:hypothetical protein